MTKPNFLKLTAFLLVLPFVNIYFNSSVRPSAIDELPTDKTFNVLDGETNGHRSCFIPHLHKDVSVFETPDFGFEMGKYIKDNFGKGANYKIKTVVIDAGHGGRDGGTSGKYAVEKDIALKIANHLGANLRYHYPNVRFIFTRSDDRFIPLNERARIANDAKADLFISIHCNSLPNSPMNNRVKGSETYVMGLHTAEQNLNVAKRENSSILYEQDYQQRYDGYDPNSPEGHIILSMFQNAYLGQSILLAEEIENKLASAAGRGSLGVKQAGFVVLKQTTMPSVLVETGYLSNTEDEKYLSSETGQSNMALSILDAFTAYKQAVEDNNPEVGRTTYVESNTKQVQVKSTSITVGRFLNEKQNGNQNPLTTNNINTKQREATVQPVSRGMAPPLVVNNKDNTTKAIHSKTDYKVLLATSNKLIDTGKSPWKDIDYSVQVLREKESYKYLVIGFSDKTSATKVKEEMRKKGFKEAFVVGYRNGIRVE
jgi:N-acetylmuramoyl-L-alanine amidase